jgi:hypothetical protein
MCLSKCLPSIITISFFAGKKLRLDFGGVVAVQNCDTAVGATRIAGVV